jgi:hypothetical protein
LDGLSCPFYGVTPVTAPIPSLATPIDKPAKERAASAALLSGSSHDAASHLGFGGIGIQRHCCTETPVTLDAQTVWATYFGEVGQSHLAEFRHAQTKIAKTESYIRLRGIQFGK